MHRPRAYRHDTAAPVVHKRPFDRANQGANRLRVRARNAALLQKQEGNLAAGKRPLCRPQRLDREAEDRAALELRI